MFANGVSEAEERKRPSLSARVMTYSFVALLALLAVSGPSVANKLEVLHEFSGPDGSDPMGGLTLDPDTGTLYGTAIYGGAGYGTVFSLAPPAGGTGKWKFQVIYTFQGAFDGSQPATGLAIGPSGDLLWGTTLLGSGASLCSCGTIFRLEKLSQHHGGEWKKTTVHQFSGDGYDGSVPNSVPVLGRHNAYLYGTTGSIGGSSGTIYRMLAGDNSFAVIYNPAQKIGDFVGTRPFGLAVDGNDTLYGTALDGAYAGTIFRLDAKGSGKILYGFNGPPDGAYPGAAPIMDANGTLYGSTLAGGDPKACPNSPGCGTIWRKPLSSGETVLHSMGFYAHPHDGQSPISPLVRDPLTSTLYGTTFYGGTGTRCGGYNGSCGTVFEIDGDGTYRVLWEFPEGGAASPNGQLVLYDGALYGVSYDGGKTCSDQHYIGCGTVWKLTL